MANVIVDGEGTELNEGEEQIIDGEGEEAAPPASEDAELVVAIGKDPDPTADTDAEIMAPDDTGNPPSTTLQNLRKKAREDAKALRQMEQERDAAIAAAAGKQQAPNAVVVGDKPTLESCDYDQAKLETELAGWLTRKSEAESEERKRADGAKAVQAAYDVRLNDYRSGSAQLKVANFKAAEDAVAGTLNPVQQSIIIKHAKNAALVVYALGNDAVKLKELAAINDPIEFAIKARELESEIKTVKRTFKPEGGAPSGSGSGAPAVGSDALSRAEAKAEKTGDRTEVIRIKAELKAAAARAK